MTNNFWYTPLDIKVGQDGSFKGAPKVVFMTLCTHANVKTRNCFLSVKTIARESGYCERTVRNALHKLADLGLIQITERYSQTSRSQMSSRYQIIGNRASCYQAYGEGEIPALLDDIMPVEELDTPCKKLQEPPAKSCIHNESLYNDIKDSLTREARLPESVPESLANTESAPGLEVNHALIKESESVVPDESACESESESGSESESKPVDKAVNLKEAPDIMRSTAEYLLLKTGRASLRESEIACLRVLSASHYPSRVQKEIDRACERFRRKGQDLQTLSFNYISAAMQFQKSRKPAKAQARLSKKDTSAKITQSEINETQSTFTDADLAAIEAEFKSRRS